MVQIPGTYQHVKNENIVEHLMGWGLSEEKAKAADSPKPTLKIEIDGKKITVKSDFGAESSWNITYILDEEVEEPLSDTLLKSTATLSEDTLTVNSKTSKGLIWSRIYKFSDSELIVTLDGELDAPTAKRYFKKI